MKKNSGVSGGWVVMGSVVFLVLGLLSGFNLGVFYTLDQNWDEGYKYGVITTSTDFAQDGILLCEQKENETLRLENRNNTMTMSVLSDKYLHSECVIILDWNINEGRLERWYE